MSDKVTHIYSITMLCCLIFTIVFELYVYFERGFVTWDGWMTLGFIFSVNLMNINHWKDSNKYIVNFDGKEKKIKPIKIGKKIGLVPQSPRYTSYERINKAKTLDDVF